MNLKMKKLLKILHFFPRYAYPILIMTFLFFVFNMMSGYNSNKEIKNKKIKFINNHNNISNIKNKPELNNQSSDYDFQDSTRIKCDYEIQNDTKSK